MTEKNDTLILLVTLSMTASILGGGYYVFKQEIFTTVSTNIPPSNQPVNTPVNTPVTPPPSVPQINSFVMPPSLPVGTTVNIDGSTSMVKINKLLKNGFESQFPGAIVNINARGSDNGIRSVSDGSITLAAVSRTLNQSEKQQAALIPIPVAKDTIAVVVGKNNPYTRSLTQQQIIGIFTGQITNWSQLGGENMPIRVINRPYQSGTNATFRELVLRNQNFGIGANFITMPRDETTGILRILGNDGISYATTAQVINQKTVRYLAIDGLTPEAPTYPFQRSLYYVYQNRQPLPLEIQAFLGFINTIQGQQLINQAQSN